MKLNNFKILKSVHTFKNAELILVCDDANSNKDASSHPNITESKHAIKIWNLEKIGKRINM